ncbi:MAG: TIGR00341 family protein [Candidatus Lokiarchaeota archaeon]|nr:TIGR00341 family protein [Candidatus Lokiarchaeota archaeon]
MKQVQIVLPFDKTQSVYDYLIDSLDVKNIIRFNADNAHFLQFRVSDETVLETVEKLKARGVGVEYGFIDILELKASLPREVEETKEKRIAREANLAVEEIYESVKGKSALTFDFIAFTVFAAIMSGIGLIQNNVAIIVASMLLAPLMGPMLGVALGYVVRDRDLFVKGTVNELISLAISFAVGIIMAFAMPLLYVPSVEFPTLISLVEYQMSEGIMTEITRRQGFAILDVMIAIVSGGAVAVSVTRGDMASLVGVAISAALMPPAVNVGMMIALGALTGSSIGVGIGFGSLALLTMNILLIDLSAIAMFRVKKLTAISDKSATWKAVTDFRPTRTSSLYHTGGEDEPSRSAGQTPVAKFTPAPKAETDRDSTTKETESNKEG